MTIYLVHEPSLKEKAAIFLRLLNLRAGTRANHAYIYAQ